MFKKTFMRLVQLVRRNECVVLDVAGQPLTRLQFKLLVSVMMQNTSLRAVNLAYAGLKYRDMLPLTQLLITKPHLQCLCVAGNRVTNYQLTAIRTVWNIATHRLINDSVVYAENVRGITHDSVVAALDG